jgi:hypothetical protein
VAAAQPAQPQRWPQPVSSCSLCGSTPGSAAFKPGAPMLDTAQLVAWAPRPTLFLRKGEMKRKGIMYPMEPLATVGSRVRIVRVPASLRSGITWVAPVTGCCCCDGCSGSCCPLAGCDGLRSTNAHGTSSTSPQSACARIAIRQERGLDSPPLPSISAWMSCATTNCPTPEPDSPTPEAAARRWSNHCWQEVTLDGASDMPTPISRWLATTSVGVSEVDTSIRPAECSTASPPKMIRGSAPETLASCSSSALANTAAGRSL